MLFMQLWNVHEINEAALVAINILERFRHWFILHFFKHLINIILQILKLIENLILIHITISAYNSTMAFDELLVWLDPLAGL